MKSFSTLLLTLAPALAVGSAGAADCLDSFRAAVHGENLAKKNALVLALDAKSIQCLYEKAGSEAIEPSFYLDETHRATQSIQAFAGKNSLPVGKTFEKHFFSPKGSATVFGYNEGTINHVLCSPGFFEILPNDSDRGQITFDYRQNLEARLRGVRLGEFKGAQVSTVKNNTGNLIFGGLLDVMKKIDGDIAIGQALKKGKAQSTFIIVRKP